MKAPSPTATMMRLLSPVSMWLCAVTRVSRVAGLAVDVDVALELEHRLAFRHPAGNPAEQSRQRRQVPARTACQHAGGKGLHQEAAALRSWTASARSAIVCFTSPPSHDRYGQDCTRFRLCRAAACRLLRPRPGRRTGRAGLQRRHGFRLRQQPGQCRIRQHRSGHRLRHRQPCRQPDPAPRRQHRRAAARQPGWTGGFNYVGLSNAKATPLLLRGLYRPDGSFPTPTLAAWGFGRAVAVRPFGPCAAAANTRGGAFAMNSSTPPSSRAWAATTSNAAPPAVSSISAARPLPWTRTGCWVIASPLIPATNLPLRQLHHLQPAGLGRGGKRRRQGTDDAISRDGQPGHRLPPERPCADRHPGLQLRLDSGSGAGPCRCRKSIRAPMMAITTSADSERQACSRQDFAEGNARWPAIKSRSAPNTAKDPGRAVSVLGIRWLLFGFDGKK